MNYLTIISDFAAWLTWLELKGILGKPFDGIRPKQIDELIWQAEKIDQGLVSFLWIMWFRIVEGENFQVLMGEINSLAEKYRLGEKKQDA